MTRAGGRVLYVGVCGSPVARDVGVLVSAAQRAGWQVCVLASPSAVRFIDVPALELQTGYPVRSQYKNPGEPDLLPRADAIVVAPATCNTINKWAAGISDTLLLGVVIEAMGMDVPIVTVPYSNRAQAAHPMFRENLHRLHSWGVRVLFGDDVCVLRDPGQGEFRPDFPWQLTLSELACEEQFRAAARRRVG